MEPFDNSQIKVSGLTTLLLIFSYIFLHSLIRTTDTLINADNDFKIAFSQRFEFVEITSLIKLMYVIKSPTVRTRTLDLPDIFRLNS